MIGETGGYVANSTFTVSYTCSNGASGTLTLKDGETKSVNGLPLLTTCSLSETGKPPTKDASYSYGNESWTPSSSLTVNSSQTPVAISLQNPIVREKGGFTVTKHVTGETGGYVANSTFTVSYTCSDGSNGTLTLKDGQTASVGNLPLLTTCSLSETVKPPTKDASYAYGAESWVPSSSLTVNSTTVPVALTLNNPINRVLGGFSVTKHVTGETGGYTGGTFTVHYVCNDASATSGDLTVTDGTTASKSGLPLGTTCTLSETAKAPLKDASYAWGAESFSVNPVTVNSNVTPVAVSLTNPITRVLGSFSVTKHVTGETGGYVAGSQFTVSYTCSNGASGSLQLTDGETKGVGGLPLLTTCNLVESGKPATKDVSYVYGTESWTPSSSLTIASSQQVAAVTPDQPDHPGPGQLQRDQARDGRDRRLRRQLDLHGQLHLLERRQRHADPQGRPDPEREQPAVADDLLAVGDGQARHQGRQLRLRHRDLDPVQQPHHQQQPDAGGADADQPDQPGPGQLQRDQARDG